MCRVRNPQRNLAAALATYNRRRMLRYAGDKASTSETLKCCDRIVYTTTDQTAAEQLQNYYRIIFALVRGAGPGARRGLPLELVTYIYRYAGFTSPYLNKPLSDHLKCQRFTPLSLPDWVRKSSVSKTTNMILVTCQISASALQRLGKVEIVAKRARGRRGNPGHWDNFVIKINRQADSKSHPEADHSISDIEWPCFEGASKKKSDERRLIIDQSHEIWDYFQPGDRLEVGQKDYPWAHPEKLYEVSVRIWDLWEPSSKVLALV
ncbi:hypothetical protein FRC09_008048 [Ceratobasidium sp. 395]|nr:hypothetical protein FRC09_008048 [Ceratobasidium sp. 395]